jgi:arsenate reductase
LASLYNVLFVCRSNAARSIMAEAILSRLGGDLFTAYSAGIHPAARVHPETVRQMELAQMSGEPYRTKSWEMFAWPGAPRMDVVITLCDVATGPPMPRFPGSPFSLHWPVPDPEAADGSRGDSRQAFGAVFELLNKRIRTMVALSLAAPGEKELRKRLERMAKSMRRLADDELMAGAGEPVGAGLSSPGVMPA